MLAPDCMGKVKMRELYWQLHETAEKYGIEKSEMLDDLRQLTHKLTAERAALTNRRDGDRFHFIIEGGDATNYDSTHFFTVQIDSELFQKRFHVMLSIFGKEAYGTDGYADTHFPSWLGNRYFAGQV